MRKHPPRQFNNDRQEFDKQNKTTFLNKRITKGNPNIQTKDGKSILTTNAYHKTQICPYFISGSCSRGLKCCFAHSHDELKQAPNLKKTKLCKQYQQKGVCSVGASCSFAHGENEMRSTPEFFKTSICVMWKQGNCTGGAFCRFAHGENQLQKPIVIEPVKLKVPDLLASDNIQQNQTQIVQQQSMPTNNMMMGNGVAVNPAMMMGNPMMNTGMNPMMMMNPMLNNNTTNMMQNNTNNLGAMNNGIVNTQNNMGTNNFNMGVNSNNPFMNLNNNTTNNLNNNVISTGGNENFNSGFGATNFNNNNNMTFGNQQPQIMQKSPQEVVPVNQQRANNFGGLQKEQSNPTTNLMNFNTNSNFPNFNTSSFNTNMATGFANNMFQLN